MEHHGGIPKQNIVAIIPARYASTRLPGKMLLQIEGKPLIVHTLQQVTKSRTVARTIVATDDHRIFDVVTNEGFEAAMTSEDHLSGSDRIAEVAEKLENCSIVVNVQGDEPVISPDTIDRAVYAILEDESAQIVTSSEELKSVADILDPSVVKVVTDTRGFALYFSRSPIPFPRNAIGKTGAWEGVLDTDSSIIKVFRKHTGLYVYRRDYLLKFSKIPPTLLERIEMLEQLRALENGANIKVIDAHAESVGVDTYDDLERVRAIFHGRTAS